VSALAATEELPERPLKSGTVIALSGGAFSMAGYLKAPRDGRLDFDAVPVRQTPAVQNQRGGPPRMDVTTAGPGIEKRRVPIGAPVSVLLVDDERALLKTTQRLLEQRGFSVVAVDTAEAALDLLSSGRPFDLLMTDVGLRRTNGLDLARRARLLQPALRVLYVSGSDAASFGLSCPPGSSPDAFLEKPYTVRELDARLRDLLLPEEPAEKGLRAGVTSRDRLR
jgi:CheY-like chemotaxis protein